MGAVWPYIECFSTILLACELLFCVPMLELRVSRRTAALVVSAFFVVFNSRILNNALGYDWIISLTTYVIFMASVVVIHTIFSCSWRLALFCGTAGYATENLIYYVRRLDVYFPSTAPSGLSLVLLKVVLIAVIVVAVSALARRYPKGHEPVVSNWFMLSFVILVIVVTNVLSTWVRVDALQSPPMGVYAVLCNLMLLIVQFDVFRRSSMEQERQIMERIMAERERQLRLSQENVDLINVKCHDLKHQIAALRDMPAGEERDKTVSELEQAVLIYDSTVRTDNQALDTVLTEKGLLCESRSIDFTCIADDSCLEGMGAVDLYTLFGNALDNAIEAAAQVSDPDGRMISLHVARQGGLVRINVDNTCVGKAELVDGLPATTKGDTDYHGFGLRSIRMIVERYGGNMVVTPGEGTFSLSIILPAS